MGDPNELLAKARLLYRRSEADYRDSLLECGRLLHQFVLSFLTSKAHLPNDRRTSLGYTRPGAISVAAKAIGIAAEEICKLIGVAMAADLLGPDCGGMGYAAVRRFYCFVRRRSFSTGKSVGRPGCPVELAETWEVKPDYDGPAQKLFREAAESGVGWREARERALALYDNSTGKGRRRRPFSVPQKTSWEDVLRSASRAGSGDVAAMCRELIEAAEDPAAVALHLQATIEKYRSQKRQCQPA